MTQPLTSKMIAAHPSTFQLYLQRALKDNWVTQEVRQPPPPRRSLVASSPVALAIEYGGTKSGPSYSLQ